MADIDITKDISGRNSFNPIYVDTTGSLRRAPDGSILNISGVNSSTGFQVNGKEVLLADDSGSISLSLQNAYDKSIPDIDGAVRVRLTNGKPLIFSNENGLSEFLRIDPTGKIKISSELKIDSSIVSIFASYLEADHWNIFASDGNKISLIIEPKPGVVYVDKVVRIRSSYDGPIDFYIDNAGKTYIRSLIFDEISGPKITEITDKLTQIENQLLNVNPSNILGFEFIQNSPSANWTIIHNANTKRIQFTIYDENMRYILPNDVIHLNENTMIVQFGVEQTGVCIFTCLIPPVTTLIS